MYLTYEVYLTLGGSIDETTFNRLEMLSHKFIDRMTFERLKSMEVKPSELEMLVFEMIGIFQKHNTTGEQKDVETMSNNGISVKYADTGVDSLNASLADTVKLFLSDVRTDDGNSILYAGVKNVNPVCRQDCNCL